ncbi:MAG: phage holin family protein [Thiobacillaceae bacterium]
MAEEFQSVSGGLFESLRNLSVSLVSIVYTRLELLSTDVAEERERLTSFMVLTLLAIGCLGIGIVLLAVLVVVAFWDSYRMTALIVLTGTFLLAGLGVGWCAMHRVSSKPRLFEASLAELSRDQQSLGSNHE